MVLMLLHSVLMTLIFTSLCYRIHLQMTEEQDLQSVKALVQGYTAGKDRVRVHWKVSR